MSRTRSFFNGALFAYLYQACMLAIGLWLTPFYIRTLGQQDYGVWLVGLQVLTFLLLCDFGIIAVVPRDIAQLSGLEQSQAGSEQLAVMIAQTLKVVLVQTGLIAIVALGLILYPSKNAPGLRGPIALVLIVFVLSYPLRLFPALLQGLQDLAFVGKLRLWLWAFSTALVVVLLLAGARFYALACGWCVQQVGHDLVACLRLQKLRPDLITRGVWKKAGPFQWRWFTRGFWVSIGQAAYSLVSGSDLLIIARFLGPATVVIYSCTNKLITVLQNQPQTLAAVALPGLSHMKTSESRERILQATTSLTQAILLMVGAVFCVILSINQQFVTLWLGERFFGGMNLTAILLLNFLVRQIDYTLAIALFAFGYERFIAVRCLVEGIASVIMASLLIGHFGLGGVAFGFLCGSMLIAIPTDAYLLAREFKISIFRLVQPYIAYLWRFALVASLGLALKVWMPSSNLFQVVITASLVGLAYLLVVLPYVWRTPLRGYIQSTAATISSAIRGRMLGWSNNA